MGLHKINITEICFNCLAAMIDVLDAHNLEEESTISSKTEFKNEVKNYVKQVSNRFGLFTIVRQISGPKHSSFKKMCINYWLILLCCFYAKYSVCLATLIKLAFEQSFEPLKVIATI